MSMGLRSSTTGVSDINVSQSTKRHDRNIQSFPSTLMDVIFAGLNSVVFGQVAKLKSGGIMPLFSNTRILQC